MARLLSIYPKLNGDHCRRGLRWVFVALRAIASKPSSAGFDGYKSVGGRYRLAVALPDSRNLARRIGCLYARKFTYPGPGLPAAPGTVSVLG